MIRPVVAVLGCLLLAACTPDGTSNAAPSASATSAPASGTTAPSDSTTSAPAPVAGAVLRCVGQIGTDAPPTSFETVLGVVALPASARHGALQTSRSGGAESERLFAKTGLVVKAGATFDLIVPDGTTLGIGWGSGPTTPSRRLHIPACPSAGGDGWLAYPGGYWTNRPACVPLIVAAGGREQQVRIGLGTPCAGQQPPEQPSDR